MLFKLFGLILGIIAIAASRNVKFFRRDYTYIEDFDAFYKLHWADDARLWEEAFLTCDNEGAKLFYPDSETEWQVAANLSDSLNDVEGIFVGVRDNLGRGDFMSIDGNFITEFSKNAVKNQEASESKCIVMSVHTGIYSFGSCKNKRPFVCKKLNKDDCPTVDSEYLFIKSVNKCIKVNEREDTWENALHMCIMEGGTLSTSIQYDRNLRKFLNAERYFVGFRRMVPNGAFYTVKGSKINVYGRNNENNCGVIQKTSHENNYESIMTEIQVDTENCNITLPFICEIEAGALL